MSRQYVFWRLVQVPVWLVVWLLDRPKRERRGRGLFPKGWFDR